MDKEIHIKFENGSEIKSIPCDNDSVRGKRAEMFKEYYQKYPWEFIELKDIKLSLWQKLMLKYWYGRKK